MTVFEEFCAVWSKLNSDKSWILSIFCEMIMYNSRKLHIWKTSVVEKINILTINYEFEWNNRMFVQKVKQNMHLKILPVRKVDILTVNHEYCRYLAV